MTVKEAILTLNANAVIACERAGFDSATVKMVEDALDTIEDALKANEPRVMTLDDVVALQEWKGDAWIEETAMPGIPPRIIAVTLAEKTTDWQGTYMLWFSDERCHYVTDYNLNTADGWRCWTSRPTDEQREATAWA